MNGGDLTTVAFTVPGVRMNVGGGNGNFNANGIPLTSILFTINGADVMDPYNNLNNSGASNNLLGANEVAEAAVILNAFSPQYGRMAGGQVNLVGKSGTNSFHGNAIYNYNDAIFNANSFFQNSTSTPARSRRQPVRAPPSAARSARTRPSSLWIRRPCATPCPAPASSPFPRVDARELRAGARRRLGVPIYQARHQALEQRARSEPRGNVANGTGAPAGLQQSPGLRHPHLRHSAPTANPFVNGSSGPRFGIDVPCARAFGTTTSSVNVENLFIAKVDHTLTDKQKLTFRYQYDWGLQATSTSAIDHLFDSKSSQPQHQGQMNYTYVITPRLVNTFIGQSSWYTAIFGVQDFAATWPPCRCASALADGGAQGGGFATVGANSPPAATSASCS